MLNNQNIPGGIETCDLTWNPIGGCLHDCSYCYLKRKEKRFKSDILKPKFRPEYLRDFAKRRKPLSDGTKIFVGSAADMWGEWVPAAQINKVLDVARNNPEHTFQFLTKNPCRYDEFDLPRNGWYGTTVDGKKKTLGNLAYLLLSVRNFYTRFVSFEPLLEPVGNVNLELLNWIIIGADSTRGVRKPPEKWADRLIEQARDLGIPVWMKENYGYPEKIKEFPVT